MFVAANAPSDSMMRIDFVTSHWSDELVLLAFA